MLNYLNGNSQLKPLVVVVMKDMELQYMMPVKVSDIFYSKNTFTLKEGLSL